VWGVGVNASSLWVLARATLCGTEPHNEDCPSPFPTMGDASMSPRARLCLISPPKPGILSTPRAVEMPPSECKLIYVRDSQLRLDDEGLQVFEGCRRPVAGVVSI
jgi:hypothetical protein